ncbi:unnamed protein product [Mytilus edulis]|uniref:Uncharacterized protein n=1 Tax=Mytilus edulis TaxID=6550 RepID=A0A8S3S2Z5_MYTED|nr:unnamed protein product [Mytilus edulis]
MKTKYIAIGLVLLVTFIRFAWSKTCEVRNERTVVKRNNCELYIISNSGGSRVCVCFIFYKYKAVNKTKKATITQPQNPSPTPNSRNIEMEERLYDIIDDEDLSADQHLQEHQMSPDYLDVISGSNSTGSGDGITVENHENIFESLSTEQIKMLVNKVIFNSLNKRESTSSSGEDRPETRQDYLNPYQSVLKTSPPNIREYLTLATVHSRTDRSMVENKSGIFCTNDSVLHDPIDLEEIGLRRPYEYEKSSISVDYAVPQRCVSSIKVRESKSCENVNGIKWLRSGKRQYKCSLE